MGLAIVSSSRSLNINESLNFFISLMSRRAPSENPHIDWKLTYMSADEIYVYAVQRAALIRLWGLQFTREVPMLV